MGYHSRGGIYQDCLGCFFILSTLLCILLAEQRSVELQIAQNQGEVVDVYTYLRRYVRRFFSLDMKRTQKLRTNWQQFGLFFIAMVHLVDLRHFGTWEKVIQLDFQIVYFFRNILSLETAFPYCSGWKHYDHTSYEKVSNILRLHFLNTLGGNPMKCIQYFETAFPHCSGWKPYERYPIF